MSPTKQELRASLWLWDVPYLNTTDAFLSIKPLEPKELVAGLITAGSSRLHMGVIAFYLRHPEFADTVREILPKLDEHSGKFLKHYYTAAVYLQCYWRSALKPWSERLLPDFFSKELNLPEPGLLHGRVGLLALEESLQKLSGEPFNFMASFNALAQLLGEFARA